MSKSKFDKWLDKGVRKGYCTPQYCETHEGMPLTEAEIEVWDGGGDPCAMVVRLGTPEDWDRGFDIVIE